MRIPETGAGRDDLFSALEDYRTQDVPWKSGRAWGFVYDPGDEVRAVGREAYNRFMSENALDPTSFPSLLRLENDIVAMGRHHLRGDQEVSGSFTSGGTESIILAVKSARDHARVHRPEITEPEMVAPVTAHAAFHKAAHYLGVKLVATAVQADTYRAEVERTREAITPNTILLVASAASYAHGVVDPIEEMGALALEHDLLLHVDGCIGAFILPYLKDLGADIPNFDFSVPGVTSISMDLHKYAFTPKGASLILYRTAELRRHQIFSCAEWSGYSVVNPTVQSTKSGGPLAAAWAVLQYVGRQGYLEMARPLLRAQNELFEGINGILELQVLGKPDMPLMAFSSDTVSVFHIADEMKERGWYVQPQLEFAGSPASIHLTVAPANVQWVDALIHDLKESVSAAKNLPTGQIAPLVTAGLEGLEPSDITKEMVQNIMSMFGGGGGLPTRMAEVNEALNAMTPPIREELLTHYVNQMFEATL
jgi:glutamate/tyrosine decarboxylase-like PLP-dependent enzyme